MALGRIYKNNSENQSEKTYIMKLITDYKHNPEEQRMLEASKRRTVFEINHKFLNSRVNQSYVFPRKKDSSSEDKKEQESDNKDDGILSELTNITLYDLSSQNKEIKDRLNQKLPGRDASPSDKLLDYNARRTVNKFERKVPSQDIIMTENSQKAVRLRIMSQISGRREDQNEKHTPTTNVKYGKDEIDKNTRFSGSKTTTAVMTSSKPDQFFIAENKKKLRIAATINNVMKVDKPGDQSKNNSYFEDQTNINKTNERTISQNASGIYKNESTFDRNINKIISGNDDQQENIQNGLSKQMDSLILSTQQGLQQQQVNYDNKIQKQQVRSLARKHKPSSSLYQAREISYENDNNSSGLEQFFEKQQINSNNKNPDLSALQVSIPHKYPVNQPSEQSDNRITEITSYVNSNNNNLKKSTPSRIAQQNLTKSQIEQNFDVAKLATSQNFRKVRAHVKLDQSLVDFSSEIQPNKALTTQHSGNQRNINFHMIRPSSSTKSNSNSNPAKITNKFTFENTINGFQINNTSSNDFNKTSGNLFETLSPMNQSSAKQTFQKINNPIRQRQLSASKQQTSLNKSTSKNKKISSISHGIFIPEVISLENSENNQQLISLIQKQQGQQQQKQLQKSFLQTQQIFTAASPYKQGRKEKFIDDSSRPVKTEGDMGYNRISIEKSPQQAYLEPNYMNLTAYSNNNRYSANTNRSVQQKNIKNNVKISRQQTDSSPKDHQDGIDYDNDLKQFGNVKDLGQNGMRPSSKSQSQSNRLTQKPNEVIAKKQENNQSAFLQNISSLVRSAQPVEYVNISTSCSSNKVERLDSAPKYEEIRISQQGTKGNVKVLTKSDEERQQENGIKEQNISIPQVDSHIGQNNICSPMNQNINIDQQPLMNGIERTIKLKRKKKPQLSVSVVQ